jgi:hypothetical protein
MTEIRAATIPRKGSFWGFAVDLVVAAIPAIDIAIAYRGWPTYVGFWIILATLRYSHRWAINKGWSLWRLGALKLAILIIAEIIIAVMGTEVCNEALTSCHRVLF